MNQSGEKSARNRWEVASKYWDKYRALTAEMLTPLTRGLLEETRIGPGQRVLDIGGGSGEPSLTIAPLVGPNGSVMFTDPAGGMVETTRTEATKRGLTHIQFTQCSADALPFPDGTFDVAVGRLSAMFFTDPAIGVREALRVLVENGCVSFVVWGPEDANPFFSSIGDVLDQFVQTPEDPDAPDPFRFAAPGALAGILEAANAKKVTERRLSFQIEAPISFEQFWEMRTEMSESLRERVAKLTPSQIPEIKQAAANGARKYFANGTMNFPAEALVVTGKKSTA